MSAAYSAAPWKDFAVMVGGASAALAGLMIVSISINVEQILDVPALPPRAAGALLTSVVPLVAAVLLLVPEQSNTALGVELVALGVVAGAVLGGLERYRRPTPQTLLQWSVAILLPIVVLAGGLVLGGAGLIAGTLGGLYWVAPAVLAALLGTIGQAWVLLVEIRR